MTGRRSIENAYHDEDYKEYTKRYRLADNMEQRAQKVSASANELRELAGKSDELYTDPEWQGRAEDHATVESFREDLEGEAASHENHARAERTAASYERGYAESKILAMSAERYQSRPDAYYHAAVADAHMHGVHIKSDGQLEHAINVLPAPSAGQQS